MTPEISVIIPVYNDEEGIRITLQSLVMQDYPPERFEIIVVDNNSTDNTPRAIESFQKEYPQLIKMHYEKKLQGPAAARNKGIINASGRIICFMDADMWAGKDYLSGISNFFSCNSNTHYLGYGIKTIAGKKNIVSIFEGLVSFPTKTFVFEKHFAVTAALAVRKHIFEEVGKFDNSMKLPAGEDREFGNRVYDKIGNIGYSEDIVVYHPAAVNPGQIMRRYFRYGRGDFQLFLNYPQRYKELNFRLFNPRLYMPPNPMKIRKEFPGLTSSSQIENIIFYFLLYLNKLSASAGYFYEKFFGKYGA